MVPRVDQGAARENHQRVRNNQRQTGVVFSRSASDCSEMSRLTSFVPSNRETESIIKAAESPARVPNDDFKDKNPVRARVLTCFPFDPTCILSLSAAASASRSRFWKNWVELDFVGTKYLLLTVNQL